MFLTAIPLILAGLVVVYVFSLLRNALRPDLRGFPGPMFASISDIPRLLIVWTWRPQIIQRELHQKYGPLMRLGPNFLSISDPAAIPVIYGFHGGFVKGDFYSTFSNVSKGKPVETMFTVRDERLHQNLRRPVAHAYALTTVKDYEQFVDSTARVLFAKLHRFTESGTACDIGKYLHWYAWDVMGEMTWSKRLGFLDEERDIEGMIQKAQGRIEYVSLVGQMPWLDWWLYKNPVLNFVQTKTSFLVQFAVDRLRERKTAGKVDGRSKQDFLSKFLEAKMEKKLPEWFSTSWSLTNVIAGADTTAISLRALFYYLLKNPVTFAKLREEIASKESEISSPITFDQAYNKLPYFDACVKEAMRLHPPIGLPLERVVPQQGFNIGGRDLKPGTVVGINAWVVQRDRRVYGEDADVYRPERWLEASEEQRKAMDRSFLPVSVLRRKSSAAATNNNSSERDIGRVWGRTSVCSKCTSSCRSF